MAADEVFVVVILDELQRRQRYRTLNRMLRDNSNPFSLPEENFRKFYRLSREAARDLFFEVEPFLKARRKNTAIPNVIKMVTALHFFAHGSYQKSVGKDFNVGLSQTSVSRCINEVVDVFNNNLVQNYIRFPTTRQELQNIKERFHEKFQFPGVIGTIDCTHIAIVPPAANDPIHPGLAFINRKNFHSINCQLICDSDLKILNVNARFPGSVHDAAIWSMSTIKHFLENNVRNGDTTTWLLGDSGYPLLPFLLTPILGAEANTPESRYTLRHKTTRNTIERCNGVLKAYFRCLLKDRTLHYDPITAAKIINTCSVLHNILIQRRLHDQHIELAIDDGMDNNVEQDGQNEYIDNNMLQEGRRVRNQVIREHFQ